MSTPFLVLPDEYTADTAHKMYSQTKQYYKSYVKNNENTKQGIIKARKDWHVGGVVDEEEFEGWFSYCLNQNQKIVTDLIAHNLDYSSKFPTTDEFIKSHRYSHILSGIYRTSDDEFMGFNIDSIANLTYKQDFRCILPEFRDLGISYDFQTTGLWYLFEVREYAGLIGMSEDTNSSFIGQLTDEFWVADADDYTTGERGYTATWKTFKITKEIWDAHLKHTDRYKNVTCEWYDGIKTS